MKRRWLALGLLLSCKTSSSPSATGAADAGPDATPVTCPAGFAIDGANVGCIEVVPAADCPAGTRAVLGQTTCQPIAHMTCGQGFVADPSGWGCRDVQPAAECTGSSREALGSAMCTPVGDCTAAFPPAAATLFVGPSVTIDATHFQSIQAAIGAAPAGATIAVDSGTYEEILTITQSVSIVGRCAAQVIVLSADGTSSGVATIGNVTAGLSGLTFRNSANAIALTGGTTTIESVIVDSPRGRGIVVDHATAHVHASRVFNVGLDAAGNGFGLEARNSGTMDVTDSAIVKSAVAGINVTSNGKVSLQLAVIRDTDGGAGTDGQGVGALASAGGQLVVASSVFNGNHYANLVVTDPASVATVTGSVIRGALPRPAGDYGDGFQVMAGGQLVATGTTIAENAEWGGTTDGKGSSFKLTTSVVRGGTSQPTMITGALAFSNGAGLVAQDVAVVGPRANAIVIEDDGSSGTLTSILIRDVTPTTTGGTGDGVGIFVGVGAKVTITGATIVNAASDAIFVNGNAQQKDGSQATIKQVLAMNTRPSKSGHYGRGLEVDNGATATVSLSAFTGSAESGILVGTKAQAVISDSLMRANGSAATSGFGLLVTDGATASLSTSWVRDTVGVALAFGAASARIDGTGVIDNQIAVYADGSTLTQADSQPATLAADDVEITNTQFIGNTTQVSSMQIPLPDVNVGP